MIYFLTWLLCQLPFRLLFRRKVFGAENVPRKGAVILASNHISALDPPVVATSIWRPGPFMAKEELFAKPLARWYISRLYAFPVKRGAADRAALKQSLDALASGKALWIFPEGTRSETGDLKEPEMGVGMIAYRSGAPVVPAYVSGTDRALPKGGGLHLTPLRVAFGKPMRFVMPEGQKAGREEYQAAAREIMEAIAALRQSVESGR